MSISNEVSLNECKKNVAIHDKHIHNMKRAITILFSRNDQLHSRIESGDITTDIKTSIYTVFRFLIYVICSYLKIGLLALLAFGYYYSIRETLTYGYFSYLSAKSIAKHGMLCSQVNIYIPSVVYNVCRFPVLKCANHTHELFYNPQTESVFNNYTDMVEYGRPYLKPYNCDRAYYSTPLDNSEHKLFTTVKSVLHGSSHFVYNVTFECLRLSKLTYAYHFQIEPEFFTEVFPIVKDGLRNKCK